MTDSHHHNHNHRPPQRNWMPAIMYFSILVLLLLINVKMAAPYILSLLMGGVLALLLLPMYHRLRDRGIRPTFASGLITVGVTLIIVVPLTLFAIAATNQANMIAKKISQNDSVSLDGVTEKISRWKVIDSFVEDERELKAELFTNAKKLIEKTTGLLIGVASTIPDKALLLLLTLLSLFFFLIDGRRFILFLNDKIQLDKDVRENLQLAFKNTSISIIWASVTAAVVQSLIMFLSFAMLKVPGSFLAAGATFILSWIPFVGSLPVWLGGAIYLLINDHHGAMVAMLLLGVFTSTIDNYIKPMILKGRDEMHPLVSLVAIFGGINTFGVTGVIFGPVFAASLISMLQVWPTVGKRLGFKFVTYKDPELKKD